MIIGQSRLRRGGHRLPVFGGGTAAALWALPAFATNKAYFPVAATQPTSTTYGTDFNAADYRATGTTYYVSNGGNDTTGDGSSGNPWATLSKAYTSIATNSIILCQPGRYAPVLPAEAAAKSITIMAATLGTVFIGNFVSNAEVSSWGTPSSGRQQVTLASGTIAGFVDTTRTEYVAGAQQSSNLASSAANIATFQASGKAGCFRATNATIGAGDARDLTGKADTELLIWRTGTPTRYFSAVAGGNTFFENITFVGEQLVTYSAGQMVFYNCRLIGFSAAIGTSLVGVLVIKNMVMIGSGTSTSSTGDGIDGSGYSVYDNVVAYQTSLQAADSPMTSHAGVSLVVNCTFYGGQAGCTVREGRQVVLGCSLGGSQNRYRTGAIANYNTDSHLAGVVFANPAPASNDIIMGTFAQNVALYDYTGCTTGYTASPGSATLRTGAKPTGQQYLFKFDPSNLATMFTDTAGTTPVTGAGDTVGRIVCAAGTGSYMTLAAGTATLATDGTYWWIVLAGKYTLNAATALAEDTSIIMGIVSADTSFYLYGVSTASFIDLRGSSNSPFVNALFPISQSESIRVDKSAALTTMTAVKNAACNSLPHVLTIRRADMLYTPCRQGTLFGIPGGSTTYFDTQLYAVSAVWNGTDAQIAAEETAVGLKTKGKVI